MTRLPFELPRYRERLFDAVAHVGDELGTIVDQMDQQLATNTQILAGVAGVDASADAMAADVARLAAVADRALPAIVEHLSFAAERLGGIEEMLANPTQTAAAEFYRRGSYALASGWLEEATDDLRRAVESYPYHPESWFNLGIALARQDQNEAGAEAFLKCARYSASRSPILAATALLLAAELYRRSDQLDNASQALHKFLPQLDACAEIHLALAVHHGELGHLRSALKLAPALAADARASRVPSAEAIAADVCQSQDGPIARLRRLELSMRTLDEAARAAGLDGVSRPEVEVILPSDGIDALLLAEASLPLTLENARRLTNQVLSALQQLEEAATNAKTLAVRARERIAPDATALIRQQAQAAIEVVTHAEGKVNAARQEAWNLAQASRNTTLEHEKKRAAERASRAQASVGLAEKNAQSLPSAGPGWLKAAQEAERARCRAIQAEWEATQAQENVWWAERILRDWIQNRKINRQFYKYSSVLSANNDREAVKRARSRIDAQVSEAKRINRMMRATATQAKLRAKLAKQRARELERQAIRDAEQAAEEPCLAIERAAQEAAHTLQRVHDRTAAPIKQLTAVMAAVITPRPRIVPFALPGHLTLPSTPTALPSRAG